MSFVKNDLYLPIGSYPIFHSPLTFVIIGEIYWFQT